MVEAFKDLAVPVDSPTPEVTDEMCALWTVSQSNDSAPIAMRFGRHMASLGMQKVTLVMLIKM